MSGEVASAPGESRKAVVEGYEYDLFLSYGREGDVGEWVRNHFHDRLRNCLSSEFPRPVRIFFDVEQEPGTHWRKNIARALQRSHLWWPCCRRSTSPHAGASRSGTRSDGVRSGWGSGAKAIRRG